MQITGYGMEAAMELLVAFGVFVLVDVLALRYGVDSRQVKLKDES